MSTPTNTKPIFHAKCINGSSRMKLIYAGSIDENEPIADLDMEFTTTKEMIEEYGKNVHFVKKYKLYDIINECNLSQRMTLFQLD